MKKYLGIFVVLVLGLKTDGYSATAAGASFLKMGVGARGLAMGDAVSANSVGAESLFWNPAGVSAAERSDLLFGYRPSFEDIQHQQAAVSLRMKKWTWALGYQGVSYDPIEGTDDVGNSQGTFKASDQAFILGFSQGSSSFRWGLNGKFIRSSLAELSASAPAMDAGFLFSNPWARSFQHALVVKNVGSALNFDTEDTPLPTTAVFGNSVSFGSQFVLNGDARWVRDEGTSAGAGLEYAAVNQKSLGLFLRAGYNTSRNEIDELSGFSAGAGLSLLKASFSYAWIPYGELGTSHSLSLLWKI